MKHRRSYRRLFSPAGFLVRAAIITVIFLVCHLVGLREHTTFLSGTSVSAQINLSITLGVIYMCFYFAFVLGVPILMLGAGILALWEQWRPSDDRNNS